MARRFDSGVYGDCTRAGIAPFGKKAPGGPARGVATEKLRILEVGCGRGLTLEFLATQPTGHSIFGLDASDTMLRQAREKTAALPNRPKLV